MADNDSPSPPTGVTLFGARAVDASGQTVEFRVASVPAGLALVLTLPSTGTCWGVVCDRHDAQQIRHAITKWLVSTST